MLTRELPTIRATPEDLAALHAIAAAHGEKIGETVRRLIREAHSKMTEENEA